jgi:hypothetical protein
MDTAGAVTITNQGAAHRAQGPVDPKGAWSRLGAGALQGPFVVSPTRNRLLVTGCNVQGTLLGDDGNLIVGCSAFCAITDNFVRATTSSPENASACAGDGCCETPIPVGRPSYVVGFMPLDKEQEMDHKVPMEVRIAEVGWFEGSAATLLNYSTQESSRRMAIPVVLEWAVESLKFVAPAATTSGCPESGDAATSLCKSSLSSCLNVSDNYRTGYVCRCQNGYEGNPYITGGCQDVDECALSGTCSGECTNTPGSYTCHCPRGSRGDPRIKDGCVKTSLGEHH